MRGLQIYLNALAIATTLTAQTRPRPEQIRNIEQIRICCGDDNRTGTLIRSDQLQSGRTMQVVYIFSNPADNGTPTACIVSFIRVALVTAAAPDWPPHNIMERPCYTQAELRQVLLDPEWLKWWLSHGGAPAGQTAATDKLIMDLLTRPVKP